MSQKDRLKRKEGILWAKGNTGHRAGGARHRSAHCVWLDTGSAEETEGLCSQGVQIWAEREGGLGLVAGRSCKYFCCFYDNRLT